MHASFYGRRLEAASVELGDSGLKSGISLSRGILRNDGAKGALSSSELLMPKGFEKASEEENRPAPRDINDRLRIMENVSIALKESTLFFPRVAKLIYKIRLKRLAKELLFKLRLNF